MENVCFLLLILLLLGLRTVHLFDDRVPGEAESGDYALVCYALSCVFVPAVFAVKSNFDLGYMTALVSALMAAMYFNVRRLYISESRVLLFCIMLITFMLAELIYYLNFTKMLSSYFLVAVEYVVIIGRFAVLERSFSSRIKP
jgi:cellulose synthase/poly-beta-1,6-N-acetylglucosamine synthase-like glycosyltransferase